jgi:hypothetical protein
MTVLKESNLCRNMSENAKDWKSCAISWEAIYVACRKILYFHLESLKKEVKDDEERKKSLNNKRKAVPTCSQEGRNGGAEEEVQGNRPTVESTVRSPLTLRASSLSKPRKMGKCHSPKWLAKSPVDRIRGP